MLGLKIPIVVDSMQLLLEFTMVSHTVGDS